VLGVGSASFGGKKHPGHRQHCLWRLEDPVKMNLNATRSPPSLICLALLRYVHVFAGFYCKEFDVSGSLQVAKDTGFLVPHR
jgi:hypothetical protein